MVNPADFSSKTTPNWKTLFPERDPITKDTEGDKVVYDTRSGVGLQGHLASRLLSSPERWVQGEACEAGEVPKPPGRNIGVSNSTGVSKMVGLQWKIPSING